MYVLGEDESNYGFLGIGEESRAMEKFEKMDFDGNKVKRMSVSEKHGLAMTSKCPLKS